MNGDPNSHIQGGKRINDTMSFQLKSFTPSQTHQGPIVVFLVDFFGRISVIWTELSVKSADSKKVTFIK
jgi:hypothetical protein